MSCVPRHISISEGPHHTSASIRLKVTWKRQSTRRLFGIKNYLLRQTVPSRAWRCLAPLWNAPWVWQAAPGGHKANQHQHQCWVRAWAMEAQDTELRNTWDLFHSFWIVGLDHDKPRSGGLEFFPPTGWDWLPLVTSGEEDIDMVERLKTVGVFFFFYFSVHHVSRSFLFPDKCLKMCANFRDAVLVERNWSSSWGGYIWSIMALGANLLHHCVWKRDSCISFFQILRFKTHFLVT